MFAPDDLSQAGMNHACVPGCATEDELSSALLLNIKVAQSKGFSPTEVE